MQLNPARGRKHAICSGVYSDIAITRFMQLNPARGRKLQTTHEQELSLAKYGLCSSTPRGDGNKRNAKSITRLTNQRFMQLNPARGRKRHAVTSNVTRASPRFMQLNPARGRKPKIGTKAVTALMAKGLCSSTPRGDGNISPLITASAKFLSWFMQLNPARGRKRDTRTDTVYRATG